MRSIRLSGTARITASASRSACSRGVTGRPRLRRFSIPAGLTSTYRTSYADPFRLSVIRQPILPPAPKSATVVIVPPNLGGASKDAAEVIRFPDLSAFHRDLEAVERVLARPRPAERRAGGERAGHLERVDAELARHVARRVAARH